MKYLRYGATVRFHDDPAVPEKMRGQLGVVHYHKWDSETVAVTLWGEGPNQIVHLSPTLFDEAAATRLADEGLQFWSESFEGPDS